jgi:hypothetical protein
MRRGAAAMLLLSGFAAAADAAQAADQAASAARSVLPTDPLSLISASTDAWTVSHTDAGCYLLSPRQKGGSSLAIGWHSTQAFGLFIVSLALAVPTANAGEPVLIQTAAHQISASGRMIGFRLFFVKLDRAEMGSILRELSDTGTLWLKVRHTWIAHGGKGLVAALANYSQTCAAAAAVTSR